MLIKEYRIPLPLSVEEYKIAQLYMIQKKSRLESTGSGSAVEIIENTPYENGPGGSGQYTKKIYHIGSHLPSWLKSLLPKTALRVEEEAWNAYPYTKTRHTCPFIEKFFIDIETHYLPDRGETENIFDLSTTEVKNREIDLIDPIKDAFPQSNYKKEEDPHFFVSLKTGRGPLQDDWLEGYQDGENKSTVMCAYKLIKVEFKYWGMQSKIENFIQSGIRNPMLVGHRQAWAWQDEWFGLTIDDIRKLEKQTQLELAKRMGTSNNEGEETSDTVGNNNCTNNNAIINNASSAGNKPTPTSNPHGQSRLHAGIRNETEPGLKMKRESSITSFSNEERLLGIHMKHIEQVETDEETDDDDSALYFDALDYFESSPYDENTLEESCDSSIELETETITSPTIALPSFLSYTQHAQTLIFVIQGGSITDCTADKESRQKDFQTFERLFTSVCNFCYPGSRCKIVFERIECNSSVTSRVMKKLIELNVQSQKGPIHTIDDYEHLSNSFPFSSVPLLILQSPEFHGVVNDVVEMINSKYKEMLASNVLDEMNHEVYFLCDSVGGLFAFQALCQYASRDDLSTESSEEDDVCSTVVDNSLYLDFTLTGMFAFGSPIGLVSLSKRMSSGKDFSVPRCGQLYNLFHPFDPTSSRIEPIIDNSFSKVRPAPVPRSHAFPFNDDIQYNFTVLYDDVIDLPDENQSDIAACSTLIHPEADRKVSNSSVTSVTRRFAYKEKAESSSWWGTKRIDYMTYCPEGLQQFPVPTLIQLCYNSYWESKDIITFILWQILDKSYLSTRPNKLSEIPSLLHLQPIEKWLKKGTVLKIKKMAPNHRANDVISLAGAQLFIAGKFAYGPVDMASLSAEKVDIYLSRRPQLDEWKFIGTDITDKHGRLVYTVPNRDLESGVYSLKMVVRGDHSCIDCNMAILPPQTEAVVFSIDGSFLASYSIRGVDPKIRGGAVDVVRHWQELGYLIIYVSSRLLFQKYQVMSWLNAHNFPFGIVSFCETVSKDYQKHKIEFLKNICKFENVCIHAAYGSSRDISVYSTSLKLPTNKIFILGKKKSKKNENVQWIQDGYTNHLNGLRKGTFSRPSTNKKTFTALGNFDRVEDTKSGRAKKKLLTEQSSNSKQKKSEKQSADNNKERKLSFMRSFRRAGKKGQDTN